MVENIRLSPRQVRDLPITHSASFRTYSKERFVNKAELLGSFIHGSSGIELFYKKLQCLHAEISHSVIYSILREHPDSTLDLGSR